MSDDTPLLGLKNIGPVIAERFAAVGIRTVGDVRDIGAAEAYKRLQASRSGATLPVCYYLYSLQGALEGVHWDALSSSAKKSLLEQAGVNDSARRSARRAKARG